MDTKRLITAISLGLGLIVIYFAVLNWLDRKNVWHLPPAPPPSSVAQSTQPAAVPSSQAAAEITPPTTGPTSVPPNLSASSLPSANFERCRHRERSAHVRVGELPGGLATLDCCPLN